MHSQVERQFRNRTEAKSVRAKAVSVAARHQGDIALPAIVYAIVVNLAFFYNLALVYRGAVSLTFGVCFGSVIAYFCMAPLHDSVHGVINGRHRGLRWLNPVIGYMSCIPSFWNYHAFKLLHLHHHRYVNDPEQDPDVFFARQPKVLAPLASLLGLGSIIGQAVRLSKQTGDKLPACSRMIQILVLAALISAASVFWDFGAQLAALTLLPPVFATATVYFMQGWLPHHRFVEPEKIPEKVVIAKYPKVLEPLLNFLSNGQIYHLYHHAFPGVPFHRYGSAYKAMTAVIGDSLPIADWKVSAELNNRINQANRAKNLAVMDKKANGAAKAVGYLRSEDRELDYA